MQWLITLFQYPQNQAELIHGSYNGWLVILSIAIAAIASSMAYIVASEARAIHSQWRRGTSIAAGSLAMGGGVWSMHFIGMLAFDMNMPMAYSPGLTALSMLPSVAASWVALSLVLKRHVQTLDVIKGGVFVGAGIGTMHYAGMAAMEMASSLRYDAVMFAISIVVAVALAILSLWLRFGLSRFWNLKTSSLKVNVISGLVMGLAISGMHYTGMSATRFIKPEIMHHDMSAQSPLILAITVTIITAVVIFLSLAVSLVLKYKDISQTVKSNESRLLAIMETAVDGIVTIDALGHVIGVNQAVEKILGWRNTDLIGENVKKIMPEPHHSHHDGYLDHYKRTGEANIIGVGREVEALHKQGHTVPIRLAIGHVRLPGEDLFVAFLSDISHRIKMEKDLIQAKDKAEQAAQARAAFLANMSHEIRTPMNAILGFTDILLDTTLDKDQRQHAETIDSAARSLLHLLNDILDSSKLEKNKLELHKENFNLIHQVETVVSTMRLQAERKSLNLKVILSPKLQKYYYGAPDRIRQVLTNILGNAIKFTEKGCVDVELLVDKNEHIVFVISDTGIGMTPDQLKNIFEPFTQADASMSRRFGGTGLGTTISKQLVELMGGQLEAHSEMGIGSRFIFSLPLEAAQGEIKEEEKSDLNLTPLRILVVDDIEQNVNLLKIVLGNKGHTVLSASDGKQALALWQEKGAEIDIILMDIQMPVMDGLTASKSIRNIETENNLSATPIIAMTASVLAEDKKAAQSAGMNGFATKPVQYIQLVREIARVLNLNINTSPDTQEKSNSLPYNGVDWERGCSLWGSECRFKEELHTYLLVWDERWPALLSAIDDEQSEIIVNEAHALSGLSGNLALMHLHDHFASLEKYARNEKYSDIRKCFEKIQRTTSDLRSSLKKLAEKKGERDICDTISSPASIDLLPVIEKLMISAKKNEIDDDSLDTLSAVKDQALSDFCDRVAGAFNDFEFDLAISVLEELKAKLAEPVSAEKQV